MVRLAGLEPATFCSGVVSKAANSFILRHGWQPKGRCRSAQDTQWVPNGYSSSHMVSTTICDYRAKRLCRKARTIRSQSSGFSLLAGLTDFGTREKLPGGLLARGYPLRIVRDPLWRG